MALAPPRRQLTGDAPIEYMETQMNMPGGVAYMQELDRFLSEPDAEEQQRKLNALWKTTAADRDSLFEAMEIFREKLVKREASVSNVDLRKCTWTDAMKEFERALKYYDIERRKGVAGPIYTAFRKLGANADNFGAWLNLLPAGDYGTPICGAFKLILGAAGRMHIVRSSIYEALQDIPEAVRNARRYMSVYKDTKAYELSQKTAKLFSAVLKALEAIITNLTEHSWKRAGKAFFQGDGYSAPVTYAIDKVKVLAQDIDREAKICSEARLRKMDEDAQRNAQKQDRALEILEAYHKLLLSNPDLNPHTRQPFAAPSQDVLTDIPRNPKKIEPATQPPEPALTIPELLFALSYDEELPTTDRHRVRLDGAVMSLASKDRASHIARSGQLKSWLFDANTSSALLILANMKDAATAFSSPASYLVAELSELYSNGISTATLSYFCGLHVDSWSNPRANGAGMINSFLGQLLQYERFESEFDFGFVDDQIIAMLQTDDVQALCETFKTLILQIKDPVILYCFIDTIGIYEIPERYDATSIVLFTLMEIVAVTKDLQAEGKSTVTFKLLVTDPGSLVKLENVFEEDQVYLVDEHISGGMQGVIDMDGLESV